MKNCCSAVVGVLALFLGGFGYSNGSESITVAVLDFTVPETSESKSEDVVLLLTSLLSADDSLALVERSELSKVLGEMELTLSGTVDPVAATELGKLVGAKILITGRLFSVGGTNFIAAKLIGTDTGRVFALTENYGDSSNFADASLLLSEKIQTTIREKRDEMVAQVETDKQRLKRLQKLINGKTLPTVFVSIPEDHFSNPIPDPAAQTEIQKTFQELGFTIVDNDSAAGFTITGEAFSEVAGRRASLISCRARVEVITRHKESGGEIKVERETSVAVDLAENVAAKSALQAAGRALAERLIVMAVTED